MTSHIPVANLRAVVYVGKFSDYYIEHLRVTNIRLRALHEDALMNRQHSIRAIQDDEVKVSNRSVEKRSE